MERLSVSFALDALAAQCHDLVEAEAKVVEYRGVRNDLIKDARDSGISFRKLMQITGVSRERLFRIVNEPSTPGSQ